MINTDKRKQQVDSSSGSDASGKAMLFDHKRNWSVMWYEPAKSHHFWRDYFLFTIIGQVLVCLFVVRSAWLLRSDAVILQDTVSANAFASPQVPDGKREIELDDLEANILRPQGEWIQCDQDGCRCSENKPCAKALIRKGFWNLDISYYGIYLFQPNDPAFQADTWLRKCMECDDTISKGGDATKDCEKCRDMGNSRNFFRWRNEKDVPLLPPHLLMRLAMLCMSLVTFAHVLVRFLYLKSSELSYVRIANWAALACGIVGCTSLSLLSLTPVNRDHVIRNDFAGRCHNPLAYLTFGFITDVMLANGIASWQVVWMGAGWGTLYVALYGWSLINITVWALGWGPIHEWLSVLGILVHFLPQTIEACRIWLTFQAQSYELAADVSSSSIPEIVVA